MKSTNQFNGVSRRLYASPYTILAVETSAVEAIALHQPIVRV
ncbi:hypothetical protein [Oculatella sp. LEGE 06141]|nr:hypothetical protein [Oculatella sp. LEGE 06141]